MSILTAPIYGTPHLLGYEVLDVAGSLPKQFLSTHIQGLPAHFNLDAVNDVLVFQAQLGNSTFRIPAYVIHFEHFEIESILKAQHEAFRALEEQVGETDADIEDVVKQFVRFIDDGIGCDEARSLRRTSAGIISTVNTADLILRHGTCLAEGEIKFPKAEEDGNHRFKIAYYDLTQEEFEEDNPNFHFEAEPSKGIRFFMTELRDWQPASEGQSAEYSYSLTLPSNLSFDTQASEIHDAANESLIDYLSMCWIDEIGDDVSCEEFSQIILDTITPYIRHINAIKAMYQR